MQLNNPCDIEKLFLEISQEWFLKNDFSLESARRNGLFSDALTIWLMIFKTLLGKSTKATLTEFRSVANSSEVAALNVTSKKLTHNEISNASGGFIKAQERLVEEQIVDYITYCEKRLRNKLKPKNKDEIANRVYLVDGTQVLTEATTETLEEYPRHTKNHYPHVRVLVSHRLDNGLALTPIFGSIHDSEQSLFKQFVVKLPRNSIVMGDRNFGVFSVVYYSLQAKQDVLIRMKEDRFEKVVGKQISENLDITTTWVMSKHDRNTNKEIPEDSFVTGRFIKITCSLYDQKPQTLYFFTTLDIPAEQIAELYLKRQNIETNIRQLKEALKLGFVHAKTPQTTRKQFCIGVLTFNLLTAIMAYAAKKLDIEFSKISFTSVITVIHAFTPNLIKTKNSKEIAGWLEQFLKTIYQTRNPNRSKPRSYPRETKMPRSKYTLNTKGGKSGDKNNG